jgi:hypothetical protein
MRNIIVISHSSDIDGVGSAALIKMKYRVPTSRIFFTDYAPKSLERVSRDVKAQLSKGTTLFITDLGVNGNALSVFQDMLESVKAAGGEVFWFDHHPWSSGAARKLAHLCKLAVFGENDMYCAAEITRMELGFKDSFTKNFCRIVHLSDFAITPKAKSDYNTVGTYALSISLYRMKSHEGNIRSLRHMVDVICSRRLVDNRIRQDADRFRALNDRHVEAMLKDVYLGRDIAIGFAADIQKTYACMKLIEKTGRDIGVYINLRDRRGHMRSIRNDCTMLASKFGGGGHPHASGFSPDFRKYRYFRTKKGRLKLLADMESELAAINKRKGKMPTAQIKASHARTPLFG